MSSEKILSLAETLLVIVSVAALMGSVFCPYPFRVLGYEFVPPELRISPLIGLILGIILPLVIPVISDRISRKMKT